MFDRSLQPEQRWRLASRTLAFVRCWHAWLVAVGLSVSSHFISMQLFSDTVILASSLAHMLLLFHTSYSALPFCPWLYGSDQAELVHSLMRTTERGTMEFDIVQYLAIARRIQRLNSLLADPKVKQVLPSLVSSKGYNRSNYSHDGTSYVFPQPSYPSSARIRELYFEEYQSEVQPLLEMLGMQPALEKKGSWARPPLEDLVSAAATAAEEEIDFDLDGPCLEEEQFAAEAQQYDLFATFSSDV